MDQGHHWETVYSTKAPDEVSWYTPHLETSLSLIQKSSRADNSSIIDVGGGESTLVDDLLLNGYKDITVLDISKVAIDIAKQRLAEQAKAVKWLVADITQVQIPEKRYDVWHDRAVFHFLTEPEQRAAYVRNVEHAMRPGGSVIVATFGPEGPSKCSGLDIIRYDAEALLREFGASFRLIESTIQLHETPFGTTQQFVYCRCQAY